LSRSAGWNLVLSLPVILVIAWLAGRPAARGATPASRTERP
jgi:hypothetical protein